MAEGEGEWLTVAAAARSTGWNPERLRSLARRGTIQCRRGNRGLEICIENGRPISITVETRSVATERSAVEDATGKSAWNGPASAEVGRLRSVATELEATVAELREELADERVCRAKVEGELAGERALVAELRQAADRERHRADRLEAELRRPWWRRLLG